MLASPTASECDRSSWATLRAWNGESARKPLRGGRCRLDIDEDVGRKQEKADDDYACADDDERRHRLIAREQEAKSHHEHRQARVVEPEMNACQAGARSSWIEMIDKASERERGPPE